MNLQVDEIQPGWTVFSSDGQEIGTVIGVDASTLRVKRGGLLSKEFSVARSTVADIETGRVELSVTKSEAESSRS